MVERTTDKEDWLTSAELAGRTEVSQQQINYLRKEGVLCAERPEDARGKSDGFLYREEDVYTLEQAQRLGTEKTFIDSVRIVSDAPGAIEQAGSIIKALGDIKDYDNEHEQIERGNKPELLDHLVAAIFDLETLEDPEKELLRDLVYGRIKLGGSREDNIRLRRQLDQARNKFADALFTFIRLIDIQDEEI